MDCSPPGSSVHGIHQAGILEWVAIPFSRGSSQPRDQTPVSLHQGQILYHLSHHIRAHAEHVFREGVCEAVEHSAWVFPSFTRLEVGWVLKLTPVLSCPSCLKLLLGQLMSWEDYYCCLLTSGPSTLMTLAYTSCSSGKFINLVRHGFHTRSSALSTGGFLYEVSSGSVPGPASFPDPHLAGICCFVSRSCRFLPAPRGAYLPGCFSGSHITGRYPTQLLTLLENDSGHLPLLSNVAVLVKVTSTKAACQSS